LVVKQYQASDEMPIYSFFGPEFQYTWENESPYSYPWYSNKRTTEDKEAFSRKIQDFHKTCTQSAELHFHNLKIADSQGKNLKTIPTTSTVFKTQNYSFSTSVAPHSETDNDASCFLTQFKPYYPQCVSGSYFYT
jgi:hypothetical protein